MLLWFLRAGELTVPSDADYDSGVHLNFPNVAVDSESNPSLLRVHIKASKTDRFRKGIHFFGVYGNDLCPVNAMLAYLTRRGPQSGPLFLFENGHFLTWDRCVRQIKSALTAAGLVLHQQLLAGAFRRPSSRLSADGRAPPIYCI